MLRRLRPLVVATALAALLAAAGCGGSASSGAGKSGGGENPKQTFAGTCGSCHTLQAAGTNGTFGPNLDDLKPDEARVRSAISGGPGPMPSGLLNGAAADAVAKYVAASAG